MVYNGKREAKIDHLFGLMSATHMDTYRSHLWKSCEPRAIPKIASSLSRKRLSMPPRKHWYFCPHWERFLTRGDQGCMLCEPPRQIQAPPPQPVRSRLAGKPIGLRAIFPI